MIVSNLCKTINGKCLLNNISFVLNDGDKISLIGKNGVGKSTLLKALSGMLPIDSGQINLNGQTIKLLKQEISKNDYNYSIVDYIKKELNILELEKQLHAFESKLSDDIMIAYGNALEKFLSVDGYNFDYNLAHVLSGLKLDVDVNKKVGILSGGQKIKILLASLLLSNADILLLDEPTNNLDIEAIEWLENYLINLDRKMIIVSHDEEFLNNIANKIFELDDGKITEYNLKFSDYLDYKDTEYKHRLEQYEQAQGQRKKIKTAIQEAKEWTSKGLSSKKKDNDKLSANFSKERTKNTSSKVAKLSKKLEHIEVDTTFRKHEPITFTIDYSDIKGNGDINIENLICGYKDFCTPIIKIDIPFGTRVQIFGKNGSGKTTFIKTLLKETPPIEGIVHIGKDVKIGYISQDSLVSDSSNLSIYDYLMHNSHIDKSMLFNILNKFHINYEDKDKIYSSLSTGQRTRVNLAKLAMNKINVLILDEPTNHLDVEAIHILEEVMKTFNGTIICISHNRTFNKCLKPDVILNIEDATLIYPNK